ncbi:hypothetical protein Bhyg_04527 [Pseudolycoriella hygida]|uniref:Uncharacterized protein n=1 Tax=Pseudolycoriella hygida TaxID=35572 RepID=A0A9Q0NFG1_9DIPT|nr:hypothetical protein Bhyg_04527 [Pseudolycoriella hygida]
MGTKLIQLMDTPYLLQWSDFNISKYTSFLPINECKFWFLHCDNLAMRKLYKRIDLNGY